ncbi:MAG TPA: hypothetical protein VGO67_14750 [Verrucomicrobiae bacterium]|jgi:hypothetical protein
MSWPTLQDYNEAIQNPCLAFLDPDLRTGQPELNQLGLPRPIAGNFACVYKIQIGGRRWAARCFSSEVSDQQRRYEAISSYLKKVSLPYMVQFTFLQGGIKVLGRNYPLLKMEWVQGESLIKFVEKYIWTPSTLISLAKVWKEMMADLKAVSMAHGDLQHGNVVVVGDQLRLIDYDGMYVPGLAGNLSNECGHRNYQLPSRTGWDYGPYLDNFSAWVIYVSLVSLAVHPELWGKYRGGDECLIFRKEDYLQPENSDVLRELSSSPNTELRFLVDLFTSFFSLSPQDVPALDGNVQPPILDSTTRVKPQPNGANWWNDHTERLPVNQESPVPMSPQKEEASVPDPGWILDSLTEAQPVESLRFQGQTKMNRIIILGSMALVFLTRVLVEMPASEFLIVVTGVFSLNLLLCFISYKHDPSQAEFQKFQKEYKDFLRRVREHQIIVDSISAERLTVQMKLDEGERAIAAEKGHLSATLLTNLNAAQIELNAQIQSITQRRRDISTSETNKLDSLQKSLGNQVLELDRKISDLKQKESDEKNVALNALQISHVQAYLRSHSVMNSWIPGIGETYKSRLYYIGFQTAADIDGSVRRVNGIGPSREMALRIWRQGLEREARMSGPNLSSQEKHAIENKYRQTQLMHETEKQRIQAQLSEQVASARQYFSDARQSLNPEEQQMRATSSQKKIAIQQFHDAEITDLDKQAVTARNEVMPTINELTEKLRAALKQTFALRWQSAKREKEGRRFAGLRFQNYLHKIISS